MAFLVRGGGLDVGWKGVATSNYLSRDSLITNSSNYIQQVYM